MFLEKHHTALVSPAAVGVTTLVVIRDYSRDAPIANVRRGLNGSSTVAFASLTTVRSVRDLGDHPGVPNYSFLSQRSSWLSQD